MSPGQSRVFFICFAVVACVVAANAFMQPSRTVAIAVSKPSAAAPQTPSPDNPPVTQKRPATRPAPDLIAATPKPAAPAVHVVATTKVTPRTTSTASPPASATPPPPAPMANITLATVGDPTLPPRTLPAARVVGQLALPAVEDGPIDTVKTFQKELLQAGYGPLVVNGQAGPLTRAAIMGFEHDFGLPLTGEASDRQLKAFRARSTRRPLDADSGKIRSAEAEQVVLTVQHSLTALGHAPGVIDGRLGDATEKAIRAFEVETRIPATGRISAELFSQLARGVGARSANR